jgi:hypothetical protein
MFDISRMPGNRFLTMMSQQKLIFQTPAQNFTACTERG